jgi:hypothetical protein
MFVKESAGANVADARGITRTCYALPESAVRTLGNTLFKTLWTPVSDLHSDMSACLRRR